MPKERRPEPSEQLAPDRSAYNAWRETAMRRNVIILTVAAGTLALVTVFLLSQSAANDPTAARESAPVNQPTPEQLADLKAVLDNPGTAAATRIQRAMEQRENEPLALELVRTARALHKGGDRSDRFLNVMFFLHCRAGGSRRVPIDGPYLKEFSQLLLEIVEEELAATTGWGLKVDCEPLLFYLRAHPKEESLRERTLKLARTYAKIADLPPRPDERHGASQMACDYDHRVVGQVEFAWKVLFRFRVLDDGMELAKAKEILGEPTSTQRDSASWVVPTKLRSVTALHAILRDGHVDFPWWAVGARIAPSADPSDERVLALVAYFGRLGIRLVHAKEDYWRVVEPEPPAGHDVSVSIKSFPRSATWQQMQLALWEINLAYDLNAPAYLAMAFGGLNCLGGKEESPSPAVRERLQGLFDSYYPTKNGR